MKFTIDIVTFPLAADQPEVQPLYDPDGRITLHDPRVHSMKPQLPKGEGEDLGCCPGCIPSSGEGFVPHQDPAPGRSEIAVHLAQSDHADRGLILIRREQPEDIPPALDSDLEPLRSDSLPGIPWLEPLGVLFSGQPRRGQTKKLWTVAWLHNHAVRIPP